MKNQKGDKKLNLPKKFQFIMPLIIDNSNNTTIMNPDYKVSNSSETFVSFRLTRPNQMV
jgi:hypothetical protein